MLREVLTAAVSERHDSTPLPDAHPTHRIERACGAAPVRELIVNQRQKWQCHPQSELPLGSTSSAPDGRWNRPRELPNPQRQEWQCHTQSELPLGGPSSAPDGRWNRSRELPNPQRQEWPTGESALGDSPKIVFPGAFQPLHSGHRLMAAVAGRRLNETVHYELSVTNVDKAPLDFIEIRDRCRQSVDEPVWLTAAPTFAEKARCFPAATFVVGVDTIVRVGDERYYADATSRSRAFAQIEELGCRFLVFGRRIEHQFRVKSAVDLPPDLARLCDEVSEVDFRQDISSTEIRKRS